MPFGINTGYTLAEIYKYLPSYIEWLIQYVPEFEIRISDFENLPKPTIFFREMELKTSKGKRLVSPRISHKGSIEKIKKSGDFKEIDYHFPDYIKQILLAKDVGVYETPEYHGPNTLASISIKEFSEFLKNIDYS